jgi:hypothetical protein
VVLSVTPASFSTETGGHDIAEILLKVTLEFLSDVWCLLSLSVLQSLVHIV